MTYGSNHWIVYRGLPLGYSICTIPYPYLFRILEYGSMAATVRRSERMKKMTSSQSQWTAGTYLQTALSWTPCLRRHTSGWSTTATSTILTSKAQNVWQSRSSDVTFATVAHPISLCVCDCAYLLLPFVAEANAALKSNFLKEIATM